ncbi:hypothetical protein HanIR_Chr12g0587751 [Helianthus annuus]|nr:hypothetical protein HanIR_Chr12g0587751 [Helianthus annuus]
MNHHLATTDHLHQVAIKVSALHGFVPTRNRYLDSSCFVFESQSLQISRHCSVAIPSPSITAGNHRLHHLHRSLILRSPLITTASPDNHRLHVNRRHRYSTPVKVLSERLAAAA